MNRNLQLISMQRVLAGLVHNINTPLNLILGYSQQMQTTSPDSLHLQKVIDAGIRIDDILSNAVTTINERIYGDLKLIDLDQWLSSEVMFLQNELSIKRQLVFKLERNEEKIRLRNSLPLLGTLFETLILNYRDALASNPANILIKLRAIGDDAILELVMKSEVTPDSASIRSLLPSPEEMAEVMMGLKPESYYRLKQVTITQDGEAIMEVVIFDVHG